MSWRKGLSPAQQAFEKKEGGDLFTLREWLENVDSGGFIDYDGFGYPVNCDQPDVLVVQGGEGADAPQEVYTLLNKTAVLPSGRAFGLPEGTTHILWFNR